MDKYEDIKAAILKRHGGWDTASRDEIMRLWDALSPEQQAEYLKAETPKKKDK